jgi:hypothetical protein
MLRAQVVTQGQEGVLDQQVALQRDYAKHFQEVTLETQVRQVMADLEETKAVLVVV